MGCLLEDRASCDEMSAPDRGEAEPGLATDAMPATPALRLPPDTMLTAIRGTPTCW